MLLQIRNKSESNGNRKAKQLQINGRGGTTMDTNNNHWVITFTSEGPKIEVYRQPGDVSAKKRVTQLECPSAREMAPTEWDSGIYLSKEKGSRIGIIRIIYGICRERILVDANGAPLPDNKIYRMFGQMMHADFSRYSNDLNRSLEDNTDMRTQTEVFRRMEDNFRKRFDFS